MMIVMINDNDDNNSYYSNNISRTPFHVKTCSTALKQVQITQLKHVHIRHHVSKLSCSKHPTK